MRNYKKILPVILLVVSFFSAFLNYDIYEYIVIGNCVGYSLFVDVYFILDLSINKKYCTLVRLSPLGLMFINLVDIIGFYFDENFYNFWYVVSISSVVFFLSFLFYIQKIFK